MQSSMAFAQALVLPGYGVRVASSRAGLCMKAKPPKPSKSRRSAAPKSAGTGFGKSNAGSAGSKPSGGGDRRGPPPSEPDGITAAAKGVDGTTTSTSDLVENTSGATGDATPKRIMRPEAQQQLEDPTKASDTESDAAPALQPLPTLSAEEREELLLARDTSPDALIEVFADARGTERFGKLVVANRHLITELVLLRFTSAILQVETREERVDTREEEAANMRALRSDLVSYTWAFDAPFKDAVLRAEVRLVPVLQGDKVRRDVARAAGDTRLDVDAMWTVVYAAVAAWEERGRENPELANVDMQTALAEAAAALRENERVLGLLSPSLRAVGAILAASDQAEQATAVEQLSAEDVDQMASVAQAVRMLPTLAYGGLGVRLDDIVEYAIQAQFGFKPEFPEAFRFTPEEIERSSRLVEFSQRSERVRRRR